MSNKITIITICFNSKKFIEKTIQSVLTQTYHNYEYIIIDGGSSDGTKEVILRYADKLSFWCSEKDNGIYDAMNKGIKKATGDWINFMNSGDCFASERVLEEVSKSMKMDKINVIFGDVESNRIQGLRYIKAKSIDILPHDIPFCHQSVFVRSKIMKKTPFDTTYKIAADYNLFYHLYFDYGKESFLYIPKSFAVVDATDSLSQSRKYSCWIEYLRIRSEHKDINWYFDIFKKVVKTMLGLNKD